ncbi:hypothetical protein [Mesorhizobium sp. M2C.T.Ca.TU.002.02.1.1]|uniref:hypothetical protein n=1 Tax=Mesorhizobium sp. M2C.T.Ca.TU.002.02.1.1 TaxID=2496788 RepID=UPI000FCA5961|nr:hypothetical protein [Mesorhizobium sp. M2C.T.Ca.TU.002.02.1.1]RUU52931.1 hypothetical protein EOD07_25535 [Mesorhizobium sp. M2C.T.Ca.TU.002.02.1.1]
MSQLAIVEFNSLISSLVDGRSTKELVKEVRRSYTPKVEALASYLIDHGIASVVRTQRKKRASVMTAEAGDLFAGFNIPATTLRSKLDSNGVRSSARSEKMTKLEIAHKVSELEKMPRRQRKLLEEYRKLYAAIDDFCADGETVETGLKRSKGI